MKRKDQISLGPEVSPGSYAAVRRQGNETQEVIVRPFEDGEAINPGTEVTVIDAAGPDGWRDVVSTYTHQGPAQVATPAYRKGYDRIFGGKQKVGLA